jgi:hypothetical protein
MHFSPAITAISCFDWCHPDVDENPSAQLMVDVFWWERRENVIERIEIIERNHKNEEKDNLNFYLAYTAMSIGDLTLLEIYNDKISNSEIGTVLKKWLNVETVGRTRNYTEQARIVSGLIRIYGTMPDWLATACFSSLNHHDIDPTPLLKVMANAKIDTALAGLLVARLLAAAGHTEKSFKIMKRCRLRWPECAALFWFEGLLQAQNGEINLSITLIKEGMRRGLACMSVLRTLLDSLVSMSSGLTDEEFNIDYNNAQYFISKNARQSAEIASYKIIKCWIDGNYNEAYSLLSNHHHYQNMKENESDRAAQVFMRYILYLLIAWQHNKHFYKKNIYSVELFILGESHSLTGSNMVVNWLNTQCLLKTRFIMGIKMWHLAEPKFNKYKFKIEEHIKNIDIKAQLLFTIGEIDCRPEEGIWKSHKKTGRPISVLIKNTVDGYFRYLDFLLQGRERITIAGVPAPRYSLEGKRETGNKINFLSMIKSVNERIKNEALVRGWGFFDIYSATVDENGQSNEKWHLDGWHLQPSFYSKANDWIVLPGKNIKDK